MCEFIGYLYNSGTTIIGEERKWFEHQEEKINQHGPDQADHDTDACIRMNVVDSGGENQPLPLHDGRYHIVFNGEIYNSIELKEQLADAGFTFATDLDTEVILALYQYKKKRAVADLRGKFAFVIWDEKTGELFAARDPFGIQSLYYCEVEEGLFFASGEKSLLFDGYPDMIDHEALQHYFTYQFVPEPFTLTKQMKRLKPGHYFRKTINQPLKQKAYWTPEFKPTAQPLDQKINDIRTVIKDALKIHLQDSRPAGAFLSSGIDSTSIVALAKEVQPGIQTFTVGFERDGYSEVDIARETADKLGVKNIHKIITPEAFVKELPTIVSHMDDPVADPAAVPLYFVAREASKHVEVILSGEGADELFGGYNIYREPLALRVFRMIPEGGKAVLKKYAETLPEHLKGKNYLIRGCTPIEERYIGNAKIYEEEEKQRLFRYYNDRVHYTQVTQPIYDKVHHFDDMTKMQYIDLHTWLPGDILTKADRMTTAHALELRVPFLDKEVFRVASNLNTYEKTARGTTKYALRKAMEGIVPDSILYRKKLGFPVPIYHWLKNELYDWARRLVQNSETDFILNKSEILNQLENHRKGKGDYSRRLWTVLTFMIWHQIHFENHASSQQEKNRLKCSS